MATDHKGVVCDTCSKEVHTLAIEAQERDCLCNWLHTRDGDQDALTRARRDKARLMGLDWRNPIPPASFSVRMAALMRPYAKAGAVPAGQLALAFRDEETDEEEVTE